MKTYILTLQHDTGKMRVQTCTIDAQTAIDIVMISEGCPRNAIVNIVELKRK